MATTSNHAENISNGLGDLRDKYPRDTIVQNFVLQHTFPVSFKPSVASKRPWFNPAHPVHPQSMNSLDASIVLLRHLYSMVHIQFRGDKDMSTKEEFDLVRKEESQEGMELLRLVWADFEDTSQDRVDNQQRIRYQIAKDLPEQKGLLSLLENEKMWNTLWSRLPFQLFHPVILGRLQNEDAWHKVHCEDSAGLAKDSLICWQGDGSLGKHISNKFGIYSDDDQGAEFRYSFNDPAIIRVLYTHQVEDPPKGYDDLKQIYFRPHRLRPSVDDDGSRVWSVSSDNFSVAYNLVAVVKCRDQRDHDQIRLYEIHGQAIMLPMTPCKEFSGTKWRLGVGEPPYPGYLLYYVQAPLVDALGGHDQEIAPKPESMKSLISAMKLSTKPK